MSISKICECPKGTQAIESLASIDGGILRNEAHVAHTIASYYPISHEDAEILLDAIWKGCTKQLIRSVSTTPQGIMTTGWTHVRYDLNNVSTEQLSKELAKREGVKVYSDVSETSIGFEDGNDTVTITGANTVLFIE